MGLCVFIFKYVYIYFYLTKLYFLLYIILKTAVGWSGHIFLATRPTFTFRLGGFLFGNIQLAAAFFLISNKTNTYYEYSQVKGQISIHEVVKGRKNECPSTCTFLYKILQKCLLFALEKYRAA